MGASVATLPPGFATLSLLVAPAASGPVPVYQPSVALDTVLPQVATANDDSDQASEQRQVTEPALAPRFMALGDQVDDERLPLWIVAITSFLILVTVCVASLIDAGGLLRDHLHRRFEGPDGLRLP